MDEMKNKNMKYEQTEIHRISDKMRKILSASKN
jgi:hypothetical protein